MARAHRNMLATAILAVFAAHPLAMAQGERPQRPAAQERGEGDPARLVALVDRRIEQTERQRDRLREIKRRLADGESAATILAEMRERGELTLLGEWGRGGDRDGQRGPRDSGEQRRLEDVTDEELTRWRDTVVVFFEEHAPEMAERLRKEGDSEDARRAVLRLHREVDRLIELRDKDSDEFRPALDRLRNGMRIADVLGKVRDAAHGGALTADLLRTLRRDLTDIVTKQYDTQLEQRAKWLARMGQRLDGAEEKLERERAERSQRIEAQVQAMIDRAMKPKDERQPSAEGRQGDTARRRPR